MKYHPICGLKQPEKDIVIEEIARCAFSELQDGSKLTMGEIAAAMVKIVDLILMRQLKDE